MGGTADFIRLKFLTWGVFLYLFLNCKKTVTFNLAKADTMKAFCLLKVYGKKEIETEHYF